MPKPAWENLDVFLQLDTKGGFGCEAVFLLAGGEQRTIAGIFDDPYLNADLGEYVADESTPRFTCKETDATGIRRGDEMHLDGKIFDVMTYPQSDGAGMTIIRLSTGEPSDA